MHPKTIIATIRVVESTGLRMNNSVMLMSVYRATSFLSGP